MAFEFPNPPSGRRVKQLDSIVLPNGGTDRDQIASDDDAELPEISLKILALLRTHNRQNIVQITEATGANRNTVKLRLRELVTTGKIRRHGKARATWYTL